MPSPQTKYDAVIVGGGHNGLVCACYLASAGHRVRVLERRGVVGGAAITEEFYPGFRNSIASYTVSLLHPAVIRDLHLREHGLTLLERPISNFVPLADDNYLKIGGALDVTQREVAKFSARDAATLPAYYAMLERVADVMRELAIQTPPNIGGGWRDALAAIVAGNRVRRLDLAARRDLLDLFTKSAGQVLDAWFESDALKAAFGFDAIVGNFASPYTPGSAYVLLHHVFGEVNGRKGVWGHAVGGMGAITQAMAAEALARGVEITTDAEVLSIAVEDGRARAAVLADGSEIEARCVISNVNPKLDRCGCARPRFCYAHTQLSMQFRDRPYERGTERTPQFQCAAGNEYARAPSVRHHHGAIA
jgi:phytoene dehydrogenase-like protein